MATPELNPPLPTLNFPLKPVHQYPFSQPPVRFCTASSGSAVASAHERLHRAASLALNAHAQSHTQLPSHGPGCSWVLLAPAEVRRHSRPGVCVHGQTFSLCLLAEDQYGHGLPPSKKPCFTETSGSGSSDSTQTYLQLYSISCFLAGTVSFLKCLRMRCSPNYR